MAKLTRRRGFARRGGRLGVVVAVLFGLSGCAGSPPIHWHSLSAGGAPTASGPPAASVDLLPVAIPGRIDHPAIVLSGPNGSLEMLESDRWASPLADEFRQLFDEALWAQARANDEHRAPAPTPAGMPRWRLAVRIERFDVATDAESGAGVTAIAEASWSLRPLPDGAATSCRAAFRVGVVGRSATAAAEGLRTAASHLAEAVGGAVAHAEEGGGPCPRGPAER